jgi:hypothetical protein
MARVLPNWTYLIAQVLVWAGLAALGFPRPYGDDTIMIGPSVSLLENGTLDNIFLSKSFYPGIHYLFYPPTFSWILYAWGRIFSFSQLSLNMFWAALSVSTSYCAYLCLAKLTTERWTMLAAPLLVFCCTAFTGFRMEIAGFAVFALGLTLLLARSGYLRLAAYCLLFTAPTIAPTLLAYCAVVIGAALIARFGWREIGRAAAGLLFAIAVLALTTQGDLAGLVSTMRAYSSIRVAVGGRQDLMAHIAAVFVLFAPFAIGAALIRVVALRQSWREPGVYVPLLLVAGFALALVTHARSSLQIGFNILAVALFAMALGEWLKSGAANRWLARLPARLRARAIPPLAFTAFLAIIAVNYAVMGSARQLGREQADRARSLAAAVPPGATLVVDPAVGYALDYPARARMEDAMVRNPAPDFLGNPAQAKAGEVWVLTKSFLLMLTGHGDPLVKAGHIEKLFVATGNPKLREDRICRVDEESSKRLKADFAGTVDRLCQ